MKYKAESTFFAQKNEVSPSSGSIRIHYNQMYPIFYNQRIHYLTKFAENLEKLVPLTIKEIDILCGFLAQWVFDKKIQCRIKHAQLYKITSNIASIAINEFNKLVLKDLLQLKSKTGEEISCFVYNLGVLGQACLKTPAPSTHVLTTMGHLLSNYRSCLASSKSISDYLFGLGMLASHDYTLIISGKIVNLLIKQMANLPCEQLNDHDISKSIYGLGLLAKAQSLFHFEPDIKILQALLLFQVINLANTPGDKKNPQEIYCSLTGVFMLIQSKHLDFSETNTIILQILRTRVMTQPEQIRRATRHIEFDYSQTHEPVNNQADYNSVNSRYGLDCLFGVNKSGMYRFSDRDQLLDRGNTPALSFSL